MRHTLAFVMPENHYIVILTVGMGCALRRVSSGGDAARAHSTFMRDLSSNGKYLFVWLSPTPFHHPAHYERRLVSCRRGCLQPKPMSFLVHLQFAIIFGISAATFFMFIIGKQLPHGAASST